MDEGGDGDRGQGAGTGAWTGGWTGTGTDMETETGTETGDRDGALTPVCHVPCPRDLCRFRVPVQRGGIYSGPHTHPEA